MQGSAMTKLLCNNTTEYLDAKEVNVFSTCYRYLYAHFDAVKLILPQEHPKG